ncbi:MAG TPA: DinB family protein [Woeseiaceae bacterium]|nr:DinB family protein [Woeseiaceae bacterium]
MSELRSLERTTDALAVFPRQLKQVFDLFPVNRRNWAPRSWHGVPSEALTAIEQISHVLDIEVEGYQVRFKRIRSETDPVLPDLPGEQMAAERNYAGYDPDDVLARFGAARLETIETIRGFAQGELSRTGIFEGTRTTLAGMVHFLCSHDQQHLSGLQWLLAKLEQEAAVAR